MKAKELREKSIDELKAELSDLFKTQFSLRVQLATQQLTNTAEIRKVRKDIARIHTILTEKVSALEAQSGAA